MGTAANHMLPLIKRETQPAGKQNTVRLRTTANSGHHIGDMGGSTRLDQLMLMREQKIKIYRSDRSREKELKTISKVLEAY
jgi:hypothetical protein